MALPRSAGSALTASEVLAYAARLSRSGTTSDPWIAWAPP